MFIHRWTRPEPSPLEQGLDLAQAHAVVVAEDRVLEAARRGGELDDLLGSLARALGVDETGGECVAAADAVDDVDLVAAAEVGLAAVVIEPDQPLREAEKLSRRVIATPLKPNRSVSWAATST